MAELQERLLDGEQKGSQADIPPEKQTSSKD
jgi:hypothetical protein